MSTSRHRGASRPPRDHTVGPPLIRLHTRAPRRVRAAEGVEIGDRVDVRLTVDV